jgi:hypothetical protein
MTTCLGVYSPHNCTLIGWSRFAPRETVPQCDRERTEDVHAFDPTPLPAAFRAESAVPGAMRALIQRVSSASVAVDGGRSATARRDAGLGSDAKGATALCTPRAGAVVRITWRQLHNESESIAADLTRMLV